MLCHSVALVVLLSDGIDSLFPGHDTMLLRFISFAILTPSLFIPVRHLSYTSLLGILSVLGLMVVILYDGLSKPQAPGSLHEMAVRPSMSKCSNSRSKMFTHLFCRLPLQCPKIGWPCQ